MTTRNKEERRGFWVAGPVETPFGPLYLVGTNRGLYRILWGNHPAPPQPVLALPPEGRAWEETLRAYFQSRLRPMEGPLDLDWATPFQQAVYAYVRTIPPGGTRTYGQVARAIGRPGAARAVGKALARNQLPIVIPCHRVVAQQGNLHGYSGPGGVATKAWLLKWERRHQSVE